MTIMKRISARLNEPILAKPTHLDGLLVEGRFSKNDGAKAAMMTELLQNMSEDYKDSLGRYNLGNDYMQIAYALAYQIFNANPETPESERIRKTIDKFFEAQRQLADPNYHPQTAQPEDVPTLPLSTLPQAKKGKRISPFRRAMLGSAAGLLIGLFPAYKTLDAYRSPTHVGFDIPITMDYIKPNNLDKSFPRAARLIENSETFFQDDNVQRIGLPLASVPVLTLALAGSALGCYSGVRKRKQLDAKFRREVYDSNSHYLDELIAKHANF